MKPRNLDTVSSLKNSVQQSPLPQIQNFSKPPLGKSDPKQALSHGEKREEEGALISNTFSNKKLIETGRALEETEKEETEGRQEESKEGRRTYEEAMRLVEVPQPEMREEERTVLKKDRGENSRESIEHNKAEETDSSVTLQNSFNLQTPVQTLELAHTNPPILNIESHTYAYNQIPPNSRDSPSQPLNIIQNQNKNQNQNANNMEETNSHKYAPPPPRRMSDQREQLNQRPMTSGGAFPPSNLPFDKVRIFQYSDRPQTVQGIKNVQFIANKTENLEDYFNFNSEKPSKYVKEVDKNVISNYSLGYLRKRPISASLNSNHSQRGITYIS